MNTVLALESVLRNLTGGIVQNGIPIYRGFKAIGRVVLVSDMDRKMTEAWCAMNRLYDYDDIIGNEVMIDPQENLRLRQLAVAQTRGVVNLYVDTDPEVIAQSLKQGVPSLLFTSPAYARPEFRPDAPRGVRPWDQMVAEIERQQAMIAVDRRLEQDGKGVWDEA